MSEPAPTRVPDRARTDYEALRRGVLGNAGERELGCALFLRQGMAAWIRAWAACAAPLSDESPHRRAPTLPTGARAAVSRLLVSMAIGARAHGDA